MSDTLPRSGRLAGIDYGTVRIGIAITDPAQSLASPMEILTRRDMAQDERYFRRLAEQERLAGFVVGLPVHTSGEESQKSFEAREFAKWLGEVTKLPVVLFDERYTTVHAEALLQDAGLTSKRRKARRDMLAAQILLAAYLESGRSNAAPGGLEDRR
ncbi:MAG: Holliday junction resolvase RuvX [Pirellulaceae bacterium]|nr:Holliday junction resolvase RuvX [Pirellulaceae bacterium]